MFVRPFQGPTYPCLCPGASRKAARPRLLTFVLTGREKLARKQELDHLLHRFELPWGINSADHATNLRNVRKRWITSLLSSLLTSQPHLPMS
jgi:hypothetical protein